MADGGDSGTATATPVNAQDTAQKLTRGTVTAPIERDVASASAAKPQSAALAVNDLIKQGNDLYSKFQAGLEKAKADMPSGPNLQPWNQKMPEADPARAFGSWASVLGILAGALTRQPLTAALNASGQAMKAIRSNDIAAYEDAKQTWKENTDIAIKNAEWSYKQYQAGLDLMKTDYDAGAAHIKTTAALIGDIHTMQNDDARTAAAMAESKQRLAMQGLQISEAMGAHYDAMMAGVDLYNQQRQTNPQMPEFKDLSPQQQSAWTSRGAREIAVQDKLRTAKMAETDRLRSAIMAQHPDWDETKVAAEMQRIQRPVRASVEAPDKAAVAEDVEKEHPDWTPGQKTLEVDRRIAVAKRPAPAGLQLPPDTARMIAERVVDAGDFSGLTGFGRSPAALSQIDTEITALAKERGLSGLDLAKMKANFAAYGQGVKAFVPGGKVEPALRSLGVVVSHLDTLEKVAKGLAQGQFPALNAAENAVMRQMGWSGQTTFEAVKNIVAPEIEKAVTGGGGALGDRDDLKASLKASNSPGMLLAAIHGYQELMGGQLQGIKQAYTNLQNMPGQAGVPFESLLSEATKSAIEDRGSASGAPTYKVGQTITQGGKKYRIDSVDPLKATEIP